MSRQIFYLDSFFRFSERHEADENLSYTLAHNVKNTVNKLQSETMRESRRAGDRLRSTVHGSKFFERRASQDPEQILQQQPNADRRCLVGEHAEQIRKLAKDQKIE